MWVESAGLRKSAAAGLFDQSLRPIHACSKTVRLKSQRCGAIDGARRITLSLLKRKKKTTRFPEFPGFEMI
jgi:hypothetical protein